MPQDTPNPLEQSSLICQGVQLAGCAGFTLAMPRHTEDRPARFFARIKGFSLDVPLCGLCLEHVSEAARLDGFAEIPATGILPDNLGKVQHIGTDTGDGETTTAVVFAEGASKKDQILALYEGGITDIAAIVRRVAARPSYVAQVLQREGLIAGFFDLYTTTDREQNIYSRFFRNVLAFKTEEAARESVKKIDRLYCYFERLGDRAGQHQAMVLALTGKNRARWSGKMAESEIFAEWLASH